MSPSRRCRNLQLARTHQEIRIRLKRRQKFDREMAVLNKQIEIELAMSEARRKLHVTIITEP